MNSAVLVYILSLEFRPPTIRKDVIYSGAAMSEHNV